MKVERLLFFGFLLSFLILFYPPYVFADSSYVLPYPSFMPGSKIYSTHSLIENIQKFWYFGNLSQFVYNLKESDKYLVEAKTLLEYKQYLLAQQSLEKSSTYFIAASTALNKAKLEGKNVSEKQALFIAASKKHQEVLSEVKKQIPQEFTWLTEKNESTPLMLWDAIDRAIEVRKSCI